MSWKKEMSDILMDKSEMTNIEITNLKTNYALKLLDPTMQLDSNADNTHHFRSIAH